MLLEVCCGNIESANNAEKANAKRIELCRDLHVGGLTPSHDDIIYCHKNLKLDTFVLIRPRGGNFCYDQAEFEQILSDIDFCRDIGIPGVVVGFLDENQDLNMPQCRQAVAAAGKMKITFHRAFDRCRHWPEALEQIIGCGYHRILTSGQQKTALEGADTLADIVRQAAHRITILAGSGINSQNAEEIIRRCHPDEIHGSCKLSGDVSNLNEISKLLSISKPY